MINEDAKMLHSRRSQVTSAALWLSGGFAWLHAVYTRVCQLLSALRGHCAGLLLSDHLFIKAN